MAMWMFVREVLGPCLVFAVTSASKPIVHVIMAVDSIAFIINFPLNKAGTCQVHKL